MKHLKKKMMGGGMMKKDPNMMMAGGKMKKKMPMYMYGGKVYAEKGAMLKAILKDPDQAKVARKVLGSMETSKSQRTRSSPAGMVAVDESMEATVTSTS